MGKLSIIDSSYCMYYSKRRFWYLMSNVPYCLEKKQMFGPYKSEAFAVIILMPHFLI